MSDRKRMMIRIDIPLDLAESVAASIYSHADMYRCDKGHSAEDIALLCADADRMDAIAEELGTCAGRMEADRRSAELGTGDMDSGRQGTMSKPTYTDAVLFVRELRLRMDNPKNDGADLSREELAMVFMVLDSLIPVDEHDAW
jgi:hypothetical protein